jgi:hypothetical protein
LETNDGITNDDDPNKPYYQEFGIQKIGGYEPKPYYAIPPEDRDPNNPDIGRKNGPSIVGTDRSIQDKKLQLGYLSSIWNNWNRWSDVLLP